MWGDDLLDLVLSSRLQGRDEQWYVAWDEHPPGATSSSEEFECYVEGRCAQESDQPHPGIHFHVEADIQQPGLDLMDRINLSNQHRFEEMLIEALKGNITAHGPITKDKLTRATRAVLGAIRRYNYTVPSHTEVQVIKYRDVSGVFLKCAIISTITEIVQLVITTNFLVTACAASIPLMFWLSYFVSRYKPERYTVQSRSGQQSLIDAANLLILLSEHKSVPRPLARKANKQAALIIDHVEQNR